MHGDLGRSLTSRRAVSEELGDRVLVTFHLVTLALLIALGIAMPIGVLSAV